MSCEFISDLTTHNDLDFGWLLYISDLEVLGKAVHTQT